MTTAQLKRYWKRLGWSTAGSYCGKKTCKALYANRKKIMKPGRNPWSFFMQKNNENLGKTLTYGAPYVIIYT